MTTTLPALRDAMTAAELRAHAARLESALGPNSSVRLSIDTNTGTGPIYVAIYPQGVLSSHHHFWADGWGEALAAAEAWIATRPVIARAERVRRMALAIIDIKDQDGSVTERRLRAREFSAAEIADLGAEACARAGEICAGAPFEIVT